VDPLSVPPHPVTEAMVYPLFGVTVKEAVAFWFTVWGTDGLIVPFAPALGVIVKVLAAKVAEMLWPARTFVKE
jgi:hypothetical protein